MHILIVVDEVSEWPLEVKGVDVVSASDYLLEPRYADMLGARVFNCCRSYKYQSMGYYVSLLAEARGHKPAPNVTTIQDMKSQTMIRLVSDDLEEMIQESLQLNNAKNFTLDIYFGKDPKGKHDRLASYLFNMFQAPFLRAKFAREDHWDLQKITPIPAMEIPAADHDFVIKVASEYFKSRRFPEHKKTPDRYDLAILYNPDISDWASDETAVKKFIKAAENLGIDAQIIGKEDFANIAEFDALFIRDTTRVNHYTYRFARRAEAEGLVVVDDPESILRCSNKVYLAELLAHNKIPTPLTVIVHKGNKDEIPNLLGLPCILKQPDSSFSLGVVKADTAADARRLADEMLEKSDLIIAQEFLPTQFDWRIGIFNGKPLYACQYFMAPQHWQIINQNPQANHRYGRVKTLPVELAPARVVKTAIKAANLIGDGLYGVDLKQIGKKVYVIEVNDNPTIQSGFEDAVLKDELYRRIMEVFLQRLEQLRLGLKYE
jgi:glutathione synthase/RimK-type ligase-like ATP-grasp enzyme